MSGGFYHYPGGWSAGEALQRTDALRAMREALEDLTNGGNRATLELDLLLVISGVIEERWARLAPVLEQLDRFKSGDVNRQAVRQSIREFVERVKAQPITGDLAGTLDAEDAGDVGDTIPPPSRSRRATPAPAPDVAAVRVPYCWPEWSDELRCPHVDYAGNRCMLDDEHDLRARPFAERWEGCLFGDFPPRCATLIGGIQCSEVDGHAGDHTCHGHRERGGNDG